MNFTTSDFELFHKFIKTDFPPSTKNNLSIALTGNKLNGRISAFINQLVTHELIIPDGRFKSNSGIIYEQYVKNKKAIREFWIGTPEFKKWLEISEKTNALPFALINSWKLK